ncbi:hypothetical protein J4573_23975 [Actinomadura barringtoniae]|uniref:Uncharacterized protein n=1 Tax=Actinomadura barringtoniae TaxID=1427535 RepID=A0A939PHG8_9ACTN|nr:hypothetical protein [Actinomadura barringtoniae]MBO2450183.1 hypothetical protein [Actinomadura barringtoniae]
MTTPSLPRDELKAALAARQELGHEYDDAFVESLAERIEQTLAVRAAGHPYPAAYPAPPAPGPRRASYGGGADLALAIISMVAAIPLSAIAVVNAGTGGLFIVLTAIVLINFAHVLRPRRG